jgi:16S rRNA (guanine966-N2)-methyltransferase
VSRRGVRITGGELQGRTVAVPRSARPTEGRVREALFSIWGRELPGSRLLDLFAGSGVVAAEAAGRGALSVVAVESDRRALRSLDANLRELELEAIVEIRRGELPGVLDIWARERRSPFHLIFADPPYGFGEHPGAYEDLLRAAEPLLAEDGQICVEHSARVELPVEVDTESGPLIRADVRRYGESALSFYRRLSP